VRRVSSERIVARVAAALAVVGLGLVAAFVGSSTTAATSGGTTTYRGDFRRLNSGGATEGSAAQVTRTRPEITHGARVAPTVFTGSVRKLPHVVADRLFLPERETPGVELSAGEKQALPGAVEPPRASASAPSAPAPAPTISFRGLDHLNWGAGHPPDTVGDVGPNHFVQAVNSSVGIFSKTGGAPLAAFTFNSLWSGAATGTACDSSNQGDPTVVYDPQGDRWIVADFAFANANSPPFYECIAVSKTSDPVSGGWYLYAIRTDDAGHHPWFADYPKMGIWPDGLYMTANMFQGNTYKEVRVWAFNRSDLESGAVVRNVVVDLGTTTYFSLLPSNMRTVTGSPPAGRDNFLVSNSETALYAFEVWKFHPDYSGSGSTFTGPTDVSQTSYTGAPSTVPTPGNSLDSLRERLMMQAQYTNLGGAESIWVNHTVACCRPSSPAGIQWAQINVTGGTVATTPVQQQLYPAANDGLHRWMGSLAVDKKGDMALGYSVANATTNPDIRYAGRLASDPLNSLPQTETTMLSGVTRGAPTGSCGGSACTRWGDYSGMTIDPDGCRFWYTQEYYETTGLEWQTRIGSFALPSCGKADQTITFNALASMVYGDADLVVTASASSGLAVTFTASGNCSVSGSTVHLTGVGSCTVTASQSGDANNSAAPDVSQSFTIAKANQTITFAALAPKAFGDADFAVSATASSGLAVSLAVRGNCTLSGATVHITGAGSCTANASQPGDANYSAAADVPQTFAIAKASQSIAFGALQNKTYGAANFGVSARASSGLAVLFSASGRCTVSGSTVHIIGVGSCLLTASQPGNANYASATNVLRRFTIVPKPCKVSKVTGKRLAAAKSALARGHCRAGKVNYAYSPKKKGLVSSQSRRPGRILPASSKINLVVSHGPRR
jgi:hypothetical protein